MRQKMNTNFKSVAFPPDFPAALVKMTEVLETPLLREADIRELST